MSNHYRTLGVDPQAEAVVIRGAYLALIRRYHPDKGGEEADPVRAQAVTAAWDVLRDPERRAAYDEGRRARFLPGGGGMAVVAGGPRVRGGAAGRNLFLLLAAGTLALGWWASQQSFGIPPMAVEARTGEPVGAAPSPPIEATDTPAEAPERVVAIDRQPRLPDPVVEPDVERQAEVPRLPTVEAAQMPVRVAEARSPARRENPAVAVQPSVRAQQPAESRVAAAPAAGAAPAPPAVPAVDLAPLERHLQLLTDQSLKFGTEAKRSRLFASREPFLKRLRDCTTDTCKRDVYLRRNAEVAEIMRN